MKVPFLDLDAQFQPIKEEINSAIAEVLTSRKFVGGDFVDQFARHFLEVHGGGYAEGCSNGTSAISVGLMALGIGRGDEVITVNNTFFATLEGINEAGADIVLVDCDPETYGIDLEKLEAAINKKTKAIIPVHLYGNPVDMDKIVEIANKYDLKILEDCAQAHLSTWNGKAVGTFGDMGTFSFYPGKNLGAYGDAGLVICKDKEVHQKVKMYTDHGRLDKYYHQFLAGNYRMDGIQGAILNVKLKYLNDWTEKRRSAAKKYDELLENAGFKVIKSNQLARPVYHLYIVEVSNRDEVMKDLSNKGIATGIHYPVPMNQQPALSYLGYKLGSFPVSEKIATRIVSLPIFPEITEEQISYVTSELLKVAKK